MATGIIYLIQPCQLLGTNRYKIGCSKKSDLSRMKNYLKGTRFLGTFIVQNPLKVEAKLKKLFSKKFNCYAGKEWFEGNEYDITTTFTKFVLDINDYKLVDEKMLYSYFIKEQIKISNYNDFTKEQKDEFFFNLIGLTYDKVSENNKKKVSDLSIAVKSYINVHTYAEKNKLWEQFDDLTRYYCDPVKYEVENTKDYGLALSESIKYK